MNQNLPVTTSLVAVNGIELVVHEAGDPANPAVLLCHGFPDLAHCWRHQMAPLAAAGYHVIAPDQRGYGHSSAPTDIAGYGIDQLSVLALTEIPQVCLSNFLTCEARSM